jgi:hypothetical protein
MPILFSRRDLAHEGGVGFRVFPFKLHFPAPSLPPIYY